ncbi:MAG: metallophosphoesterase family protein [Acidobacteria bacterium]|nr:metallophosphoesterase family protein [Acidobacteriota bacterium]
MRIGIISDIHGNLPALEAVLEDLRARNVDAVYCLGDLVGYAPFPDEVTDRIRREGIRTVLGNYDDGVGFDRADCGCAYRDPVERAIGEQSLEWTKAHVSAENKAFLRSLEDEIRLDVNATRLLLVHGSPRSRNEYLFEDRPPFSFERIGRDARADIVLFGHTHRPYSKQVGQVLFVNAGSVGKPKDGDWRACYAILDPASPGLVRFVRVAYDLTTVTAAIRQSDLPDDLAGALERGGVPPAPTARAGQ